MQSISVFIQNMLNFCRNYPQSAFKKSLLRARISLYGPADSALIRYISRLVIRLPRQTNVSTLDGLFKKNSSTSFPSNSIGKANFIDFNG